jgi:AbrB family looped-hinge helix DNA binding protein
MNTSTTNNYQSEHLEIQGTIRKKGQLTVPADIRDVLNLQTGDKVAFIVDKSTTDKNKKVEMVKKQSIVARTAGVLKSMKPLITAEKLRVEAERAIAEEAVRRASK